MKYWPQHTLVSYFCMWMHRQSILYTWILKTIILKITIVVLRNYESKCVNMGPQTCFHLSTESFPKRSFSRCIIHRSSLSHASNDGTEEDFQSFSISFFATMVPISMAFWMYKGKSARVRDAPNKAKSLSKFNSLAYTFEKNKKMFDQNDWISGQPQNKCNRVPSPLLHLSHIRDTDSQNLLRITLE